MARLQVTERVAPQPAPPLHGTPGAGSRAPFGATLALTVAALLGPFLLLAAIALLLIPGVELEPPFPEQHQDAETLLFVVAFAVILPLSVALVPRVADRIATGPNAAGVSALAGVLAGALVGGLLLVKLSERLPWGGGLGVLAAVMAVWCVLALAALGRAADSRPWPALARAADLSAPIWLALAALTLLAALAFAYLGSIDPLPLAIAVAAGVAVLASLRRGPLPALPRPWGLVADLAVAGLVFLAVPNLVVIQTENPAAAFETEILHFHQNFFLGPASQVVGGGAMLVDTLSQYGVGSIYAVAGWFELTAVSNGMIGLFEGLLAATVFVGAFLALRIAHVSRSLATATMVVGLIVLVYGLVYPIGGLLQHGAIRFGLPMAVLVAGVAEARWSDRATLARIAGLIAVGISALWALEAFGYTLFTAFAVVVSLAWLRPAPGRRPWLVRRLLTIVAACLIAHVLFAAATLAGTGELPDWGLYLSTLKAFLVGAVGDLTYDFSPWSPGVALGAVYLASAAAIALVIRRHPGFARAQGVPLVALAGSTAYGVALFSYLVNRSADHIVPYVGLPALMVGALWLSLVLRSPELVSVRLRQGALAMALAVAALLVAIAWSSVEGRFSQSALAYAPPGGKSLRAAIDRLEDFPPISAGAPEAEELLVRFMPDETASLVVLSPDLTVEVLARTGRISELPISDPWEDSLVPDQHLDDVAEAVDGLAAGDRILLDAGAAAAFARYREDPSLDPLAPMGGQTIVPSGLAVLQEWALDRIGETYRLEPIARGVGPEGLVVAELAPAPIGG